jgi:hypothetical protein
MASFGTEEFVNLSAFDTEVPVTGVDCINHQDDFDGSLAAADGLKRSDGLRYIVI